jgi:phage repressor protein C with HTH and peptisase S24 domain
VLRWQVVGVVGRSMHPTLKEGDRLLVDARRRPRPGDLVLVRLPGDRPLAVKRAVRREADGWWVERDNPREGTDSWSVGAIPDDDVLAVVLARIAPRPALFGVSAGRRS